MQIVIDIPEDVLKRTVFYREFRELNDCITTIKALEKAMPLPEHHGRLVDADWVKNTLDIYVINEYNGQFIRRNDIDTIPTIIEGSDSE